MALRKRILDFMACINLAGLLPEWSGRVRLALRLPDQSAGPERMSKIKSALFATLPVDVLCFEIERLSLFALLCLHP